MPSKSPLHTEVVRVQTTEPFSIPQGQNYTLLTQTPPEDVDPSIHIPYGYFACQHNPPDTFLNGPHHLEEGLALPPALVRLVHANTLEPDPHYVGVLSIRPLILREPHDLPPYPLQITILNIHTLCPANPDTLPKNKEWRYIHTIRQSSATRESESISAYTPTLEGILKAAKMLPSPQPFITPVYTETKQAIRTLFNNPPQKDLLFDVLEGDPQTINHAMTTYILQALHEISQERKSQAECLQRARDTDVARQSPPAITPTPALDLPLER